MDRSEEKLPAVEDFPFANPKVGAFLTTHWSVVLGAGQRDLGGAALTSMKPRI